MPQFSNDHSRDQGDHSKGISYERFINPSLIQKLGSSFSVSLASYVVTQYSSEFLKVYESLEKLTGDEVVSKFGASLTELSCRINSARKEIFSESGLTEFDLSEGPSPEDYLISLIGNLTEDNQILIALGVRDFFSTVKSIEKIVSQTPGNPRVSQLESTLVSLDIKKMEGIEICHKLQALLATAVIYGSSVTLDRRSELLHSSQIDAILQSKQCRLRGLITTKLADTADRLLAIGEDSKPDCRVFLDELQDKVKILLACENPQQLSTNEASKVIERFGHKSAELSLSILKFARIHSQVAPESAEFCISIALPTLSTYVSGRSVTRGSPQSSRFHPDLVEVLQSLKSSKLEGSKKCEELLLELDCGK